MQISRAALYDLVWKSPLSKTAPEFGVTATSLAAICRANNVPYPGSLYWTMKSLGRPVEIQALPGSSEEALKQIVIEPAKPKETRFDKRSEEPQSSGARNDAIALIDRPVKEHPIITKRIEERERQRREALATRNEWAIKAAPSPMTDVDRRRYSLLSKLLRAIEAKGGLVSNAEKGNFQARIDGEAIEFQIREKQRQTRITETYGSHSFSKQKLVGTGKLAFSVLTYWPGHNSTEWKETDSVTLDSKLPNMVERIFDGAQAVKAWNTRVREEEEQRRKAAANRAERQRQAELERHRRQKFVDLATDWQAATIVRDLVAALRLKEADQNQDVSGKTVAEWLAWADEVANDLDATRNGVAAFFSTIKPSGS
ncbi:hypothetical protein WN73_38455 [Bradyrhizobium sp. CCBAU 45394]|uniref:hypothetical protein n=1 Tax=Bradyrhizobium sp. CCBAU 45394 TaxID=1325087 RepID=UPI0023036AFA|nr:hypothetical protein [Bradyrhizobium sp. CCBAU 45394]MDA9396396.1 hypothetical protein [Bradyrhizobium sp. CCBAU 45394]